MQGKGIVKFFLVAMFLMTLLQYLFILPTQRVEREADAYAEEAASQVGEELRKTVYKQKRTEFLDEKSNEEVFKIPLLKSYTYQELKAQQLALGLDLKGGMSVVLQVDLSDLIRTLGNSSKDPTFTEALENANERMKSAQSDYVTLFVEEFRKIANGKKLAPIFAKNPVLREDINFETSDGEVARILRQKADETVSLTHNLLKERIDKLGVTQPNVSLDAARDLIIVELPGIDNPERARTFLQAAAKLEFWDVFRITDNGIQQAFATANDKLAKSEGVEMKPEILRVDTLYAVDSLGNQDLSNISRIDTVYDNNPFAARGPLFNVMEINNGSFGLATMGTAVKKDKSKVDEYLAKPEIRSLFPRDLAFRWSRDPIKDIDTGEATDIYQLFAIKLPKGQDKPLLAGDHVIDADANPDPNTGEVAVSLRMDGTGAKTWGQMTTKASQDQNREIAIALDNEIVSAPRVNDPIMNGNSSITGGFSIQEGKDLANILEIGKLPAETRIIQEALVGPSLGQDNINRSMKALIIGFLIVLAFMIFYYGGAGIVSIIALLLNVFFIFGGLASYGTVLTLPGIAGIVLTIGMAVDANVIIYERIREELNDGKSLLAAVGDGFKNSYSAIIDANVTTILTALVLAYFGLGPIKGFAVVLIIGVLCSLFTAVLVTRLLIDWWVSKGNNLTFWTGMTKNAFNNLSIDWLGKRRIAYMISGLIIGAGIISMFTKGFDLGVDFKGGYSYNIQFDETANVNAQTLRTSLTDAFGSTPVVKAVDTENTFNVVTDYLVNDDSENAADKVMAKLHEGINTALGSNIDLNQFKAPDGEGTHVASSSKVGPTIADDIAQSAWYAGLIALVLIFLYIALRFSNWQYSAGAVAALFHDVLIVLSLFSIFHGILPFNLEVDQAFIAAVLTVIGYSINDTVVVFDRIREFLGLYTQKSKEEVINMAVNSTVSRTIITSLTTFFVVFILFLFGGASIKGFAFALLIGVLVGTYSSIFIATPVMSDLSGDLKPKKVTSSNTKEKKKTFTRSKVE